MNGPLVSCIIPTFNSERYLAEAIASVLAQTYRPIEVIVADAGSTDGTAAIVARAEGGIRFAQHQGGGPAATRNLGIRSARGDFVAFLDADDLWHPEKLAIQMACFHGDPTLDLCTAHVQQFFAGGPGGMPGQAETDPRLRPVPGFVTITLLARRTAFERVGELDPGLWHSDSADWFLRAADAGLSVRLLPETLTYHRLHGANLSLRRGAESRKEFLRLIKSTLDRRRRK